MHRVSSLHLSGLVFEIEKRLLRTTSSIVIHLESLDVYIYIYIYIYICIHIYIIYICYAKTGVILALPKFIMVIYKRKGVLGLYSYY